MLTHSQVDLIRMSAKRLAAENVMVTNAFYARLFRAAPGVRPLFPEDMFAQSRKLWESIVMVVQSAEDLAEIEMTLKDLGARHVAYGTLPEHYDVVTEILVLTIENFMGGDWTNEHKEAWEAAIRAVCDIMIDGAAAHAI